MAVKASRYLTHLKRLRDPEEPVQRFFDHASYLGPRLGPVLYQLPGNFRLDLPRLEGLLGLLPGLPSVWHDSQATHPVAHVMEFRDPSWYVDDTYALLAEHGVSLCLHDKRGSAIDAPTVGPVLYVRFHGTSGHYHGSYSAAALRALGGSPGGRLEGGARRLCLFQQRSGGGGDHERARSTRARP